ncbi:MAG: hypothetical protein J0L75_05785 [Spirochaetes bacterium]|nr:hypothetical protein [Spirochaetota bacterium]
MKPNVNLRLLLATALAGLVVLGVLFAAMWDDKNLLSSGDHSYANMEMIHALKPAFYAPYWMDNFWLGMNLGNISPTLNTTMMEVLPPRWSYWLVPVGAILVFLLTSLLLFRGLGLSAFPAAAMAFLTALAPVHLTFVNAGHTAKLWSIAFFPLALYFTHRAATGKRRIWDFLLAGLFLGFAFMHGETPTTLYFAVLLTAYYFFQVLTAAEGKGLAKVRAAALPLALFALIPLATLPFSYDTFLSQYYNVAVSKPTGDAVAVNPTRAEDPGAKGWDWATQWSFPIEETPELFVAGLFGWKSGDAENPYWGRTGQTPGWTPGSQGMVNLSQTTGYLGFAVFFFALFAVAGVRRKEVWFWLAMFLLALSLAWGRHFFTYAGVWHLPLIDKFRNPNRFLHLAHLSATILAAYGLEHAWRLAKERLSPLSAKMWNRLVWILGGLALAGLLAIVVFQDNLMTHVAERVGGAAGDKAPGTMIGSLLVYLLLLALFAVGLRLAFWSRTPAKVASAILVALVCLGVFDQLRVDKHFVVSEPSMPVYRLDEMNKFLQDRRKETFGRIKYLTRGPYLHFHLTHLVLNHQLETVDIPASSRTPDDIATFQARLVPNGLKYFRLQGVRHYLSEEPYDVFGLQPLGAFRDPFQQGRGIYYYEDTNGLPRAYMVHQAVLETNLDRIFQILNHSAFDPSKTVLLTRADLPEVALPTFAPPRNGRVEIAVRKYNEVRLKTESEAPGIVVLADYYQGDWVARLDGKEVPIRRANYLTRGVFVPAGSHELAFTLPAKGASRTVGAASWLALVAVLGLWFAARRREGKEASGA